MTRARRGFTLLELIAVIVFVGACALIAISRSGEQGLPLHRRCEVCARCRYGGVCACPPGGERREGLERPRAVGSARRWF